MTGSRAVAGTGPPAAFADTRWSLIAGASGRERASLAELCARYWYPVYSFARRAGHPPAASQAIARAFFGRLFATRIASLGQSRPPSFRDWLLGELNRFLADDGPDGATRADDPDPPQPQAAYEARFQAELDESVGPDMVFRRSFAVEVLGRAHDRLRQEASEAGHGAMFDALVDFLTRDPEPGQYEAMAGTLGSRPLALVIAVRRLRQRFRELVDEELVDTLADPGHLATERDALFSALGLSD